MKVAVVVLFITHLPAVDMMTMVVVPYTVFLLPIALLMAFMSMGRSASCRAMVVALLRSVAWIQVCNPTC